VLPVAARRWVLTATISNKYFDLKNIQNMKLKFRYNEYLDLKNVQLLKKFRFLKYSEKT
jgi:hypothetical protein